MGRTSGYGMLRKRYCGQGKRVEGGGRGGVISVYMEPDLQSHHGGVGPRIAQETSGVKGDGTEREPGDEHQNAWGGWEDGEEMGGHGTGSTAGH